MLSSKKLQPGDLRITMYDMENVGDGLPEHTHAKRESHITIVGRGQVRIIASGIDRLFDGGAYIELPDGPHSIVSTKPNSRIFNIEKFTT